MKIKTKVMTWKEAVKKGLNPAFEPKEGWQANTGYIILPQRRRVKSEIEKKVSK